ncbi:conserved hypothetical protein [uncultured Eubacteriales bacterium]|uniref:Putative nitroreductase TM1586 domain-containing protein n=1 Tax=uncultured Eubacteriales bacterium TaxID=172733 RepID=A0A212KCZ8_9FIRM|nr:conserved hypothetical protein [uncultured Eubacteriales bacterium]
MDLLQAIEMRHSVRAYLDKPIDPATLAALWAEIERCNQESGLHIQLSTEEPEAFGGLMAHYGKFHNVKNYLALVGPKDSELEEKAGYYGERLVLEAQSLGLNTCWVALTFSKSKSRYTIEKGEKMVCVIALGYGETQGVPHKSRPLAELYRADGETPAWFRRGMDAALLAPTAINQQKFLFTLSKGNKVSAKSTGGPNSKVDLGIAKLHFELAAGKDRFSWA